MRRLSKILAAGLLSALLSGSAYADAAGEHVPPAASHAVSGVVNVNEAGPDELVRLPGIGPSKARLIIEHRRTHPFKKIEEITKVKGIGRKTFVKLRPFLTLQGPTTLKTEPKK